MSLTFSAFALAPEKKPAHLVQIPLQWKQECPNSFVHGIIVSAAGKFARPKSTKTVVPDEQRFR